MTNTWVPPWQGRRCLSNPELPVVDSQNRPLDRVCRPASLATFRRASIPFLADRRHLCDAVVVVERAAVRHCRRPWATRMDLSTLSWSVSTNKQGERGDGAVVVAAAGAEQLVGDGEVKRK